jgi:threonine dehydratase
MKVSLEDILKAVDTIKPYIRPTDLGKSQSASKLLGKEVFFKFENQQYTGSFKLRGAMNKIAGLTPEEKKRGVVAASAGNHAQGVAFSATKHNVKSTIIMPTNAPLVKIQGTQDYGAEVILYGDVVDDAFVMAKNLEKEKGFVLVHPFEDEKIIAGQGTIGLEIIEQIPDLDSVIVPIGGGGLIAGIATAIKAKNPKCKIFGVQSSQAPGMEKLFHHVKFQAPNKISTIADGIAVKNPSQTMYNDFLKNLVDDIVTVTDDEISEAIVFLMERAKTVTEGAGATAVAALFHRKMDLGKKTCALLCGGNIDLNIIAQVVDKGLIRKGRLAEMSVVCDDLPGNLSRMTKTIADLGANILEVHHDRVSEGLYLRETRIDFVLETKSAEHAEQIRQALGAKK